jgi:ABC-type sugar transport system permease subunit
MGNEVFFISCIMEYAADTRMHIYAGFRDIYNTFYGSIGGEGVGQAKAVVFFLIVAIVAFIQLSITRKREEES